jgi:hypothetical protein
MNYPMPQMTPEHVALVILVGRYLSALMDPFITLLLTGYGDGGDSPDKRIELVTGAMADAEAFLATEQQTHQRLSRVSELVEGFETPFGLELLATVHWVATREGATNLDEIVSRTYEWNSRKRQFSTNQIEIALDALRSKGWLA